MYYVYLLINPVDNTVFYCGKGKGDRWKSHLSYSSGNGKNNRCENKIRKLRSMGIEPTVRFLHENITDENEAYRLEEEYIAVNFDSLTNLKIKAGPPINTGGRYFKKSAKANLEQSLRMKAEYKSGKKLHWSKLYTKEEVSLKISLGDPGKSKRGKPAVNKTKILCHQNNVVYESQTEAARILGLKQGDIANVLSPKNKQKSTKGYTFEYFLGT